MTPFVFISHVSENADVVQRLSVELESQGLVVWRPRERIAPGAPWPSCVDDAIRAASRFIACFSRESAGRDASVMNAEIELAIRVLRTKHPGSNWFVPLLLSGELPALDLTSWARVTDLQCVRLDDRWEDGVRRLATMLTAAVTVASTERPSLRSAPRVVAVRATPCHDATHWLGLAWLGDHDAAVFTSTTVVTRTRRARIAGRTVEVCELDGVQRSVEVRNAFNVDWPRGQFRSERVIAQLGVLDLAEPARPRLVTDTPCIGNDPHSATHECIVRTARHGLDLPVAASRFVRCGVELRRRGQTASAELNHDCRDGHVAFLRGAPIWEVSSGQVRAIVHDVDDASAESPVISVLHS